MARKIVDIGVEGNDGTGDSIREGFRKVNENFQEIYAVFGQEGTIAFIDLGDTPNTYTGQANKLTVVNSAGTGLDFKELVGLEGLIISYPTEGAYAGKIVLENTSNSIDQDLTPQLGGDLDARGNLIGFVGDPTPAAVNEFNSLYGYAGSSFVDAGKFAINRGYADARYVNTSGDTMTGFLNVPPGAAGAQVPRAGDVVLKSGSTMTGKLYLNDHPGGLAGVGTPNGLDDLQAASKYYVDNTSYASKVNLYVSLAGDDAQVKSPPGREGRHWVYAYRTLSAACLKAEQLIEASPWETGPYRQLIAYARGTYFSEVTTIAAGAGLNGTTRVSFTNDGGRPVDQGVIENRDIVPGKIVIGRTSGARGFIVKYGTDGPEDFVDLRDITGTFVPGENLEFDNAVKSLQISIFIESGVYEEDYPIRIPPNCAILGDEFRRTVIKPADRPSLSPWATTWFYRDMHFDGLTIAETNYGYHYLTDPTNKASLPKNNKDIDVFLCNDATIIRQISCQGHGGFMMVLDPNGQILTKSPYCQQSGSFAGSVNKQSFRGGQYVDGMAGSMPVSVDSINAENTEITITNAFRVPQTPTAFYVQGTRYKIDTFTDDGQGYRGAKELLALNKDFIRLETIAYVNDVVTPTFEYDPVKCARDVGYILDAVAWDLAFDTTVQSLLVAQQYYYKRDGDPYGLYTNQKEATLDALNFVRSATLAEISSNSVAVEIVTRKLDLIIDIFENGPTNVELDSLGWSYATVDTDNIITVQCTNHGLIPGFPITISGASATSNAPNGVFSVYTVPSANTFTYKVAALPTGTASGTMRITGPTMVMPNPPAPIPPLTNTDIINSLNILKANREFIKAEYIGFITYTYPDYIFDVSRYQYDIDRMINAVIYDSIYGGNSQSSLVARTFYDINNELLIAGETTQIIEAINHASRIAQDVVLNVTVDYKKQQSVNQIFGTPGITAVKDTIDTLFANINQVIEFGVTTGDPITYPDLTNVSSGIRDAKNKINFATPTIKTDTISFINSRYLYDQFKAGLDINAIVDAVTHDILYSGNLKSIEHGLTYFVGDAALVSDAERPRTLAIINYIEELALKIVENEDIPNTAEVGSYLKRRQFVVPQTINTGYSSPLSKPQISELISLIRTMVAGTTAYTDARDLLLLNRDFIKAEVTNYIDYKYSVTVTATDAVTDRLTTTSTSNLRVGMPVKFIGPNPFAEDILSASAVTGTGPYYVTFEFARQKSAVDTTKEYEILDNSNANYNRTLVAIASSTTSLTLQFDDNPGTWGTTGTSRIRVSGGTFGNVARDTKYYIKELFGTTQFSITTSYVNGVLGSAVALATDTGSMSCKLEYNKDTCARDVGFIISNIGTDILYGQTDSVSSGRYNAIRAGLRYWAGTAALVVGEQSPETIDGINYINTLAQKVITNNAANFSYDQDTCRRDVGLILDAVLADAIFGSNYRSITAGLSYLRSYASVVPDRQKTQTIAGINKARDLALALIPSSLQTQTTLNTNFAIVTNTILNGTTPAGVTLAYSSPNNTSTNVINAAAVIRQNKNFLTDEIIAFINSNLDPATIPNYNEATCRRDLKYIIDALVYDLLYGGTSQTVKVGNAYFSGTINTIFEETADLESAYTRLQFVIQKVVINNTTWIKSTGNTTAQDTTLTPGTVSEGNTLANNVGIIIDIVNQGYAYPEGTEPTYVNGANYSVVGADRTTILAALPGIKEEVISFLNLTYQSDLTYQNLNNVSPAIQQQVDLTKTTGADASVAIASLVSVIAGIIENGPESAPIDAIQYPKYVLQLSEETLYNPAVTGPLPEEIVIQAAGNTSMLSNDWTQLNDLGYGLVATNNGLIETVSVFTYYCWVAYYANQGGQIRSVGGSNAHGEYGLIADGSDPFEVPDDVNLSDDLVQVAAVFKDIAFTSEMAKDQTAIYIDEYEYLPYNISEIEIQHGFDLTPEGVVTSIGPVRYEVSNISDVSTTAFSAGNVSYQSKVGPAGDGSYTVVFSFPTKIYAPVIGKNYTVSGNATAGYNGTYECVASDTSTITLKYPSNPGTFGSGVTAINMAVGSVIRLNLNTGGNNNTSSTGLKKALYNGQRVIIRSNQNVKFYNVDMINPTRPSTALTFRGDPVDDALAPVYRVLAFNTKDPLSRDLAVNDPVIKNEVILSFDTGFDYIQMIVRQDLTTNTEADAGIEGGSTTKTLGSQVGDNYVAIEKITSSRDLLRVQSGEMIFAWDGRIHRIESYKLVPGVGSAAYGVIKITEDRVEGGTYQNIAGVSTGLVSPLRAGVGKFVTGTTVGAGPNYDVTYTFALEDYAPAAPVFTGSIDGTTLTVTNVASGSVLVGSTIQRQSGSGVTAGTVVTGQLTATNAAAATTTGTGTTGTSSITVASEAGIAIGQFVTGTGIPANTYVASIVGTTVNLTESLTTTASGTYNFYTAGKQGTYSVNKNQSVSSSTMGICYTVLGNNNTALNVTKTAISSTTSSITLRLGADPGTFGAGITRIFNTSEVYNSDLVEGPITLYTGLTRGEPADIIVNISSCRATSHDFLDIGSGGYNQSNFPSKIYGAPRQPDQRKEVVERTTGRVFWVSTDQDGFFRVGRFFTVDQGTGTVSFAASLALSNLDGLGFKRGRAISEFSDDDTFQDLAQDAVPTEGAIDGYLNRRLGLDRENNVVSAGAIGAGFLDREGILPATNNINMGGNRLLNVGAPLSGTDATNKNYVDGQQLSDVQVDTDETTSVGQAKANHDLLAYNASAGKWVNAETTTTGDIQAELSNKNLALNIKRETIVNTDINKNAAITEDKLSINTTQKQRDQGVKITAVTKSIGLTATTTVKTGNAPNVIVRFNIGSNLATAPRTEIYYTVTGNSNAAYNGTFLCVNSSSGLESSVSLLYPVDPGVYGTGTTTVTPWETEVTTSLTHELSAGDIVTISGATVTSGTNINGKWPVLSTSSTTKFMISANTSASGTFTVTTARATKLGLATFNKNQFDVTNGFVQFKTASAATFTGNIAANSAVITNISGIDNLAVGTVITLNANFGNVRMPSTVAGSPATPTNVSQPITVTVASIDSATQVTLSAAFAGSGSATFATINAFNGIALSSLQQVPTDTIIGNLSGSVTTPNMLTSSQVVEAGDGIKNTEFNDASLLGDIDVRGIMTIIAKGTSSWQNTYGVFNVTKTGAINSVVRTDANGAVDAQSFRLDSKLALDSSNSADIDFYTPGGTKFLTSTGVSTNPAGLVVNIGALDSGILKGTVSVPKLTAVDTVTFDPANANISIQPTGTGTVTIKPANVGTINNMSIGNDTRSSALFTTLGANDLVTFTSTNQSLSTGSGALVVDGGVGIKKNLNVGGDATITGNLTVNGTTTTINSTAVSVDDINIILGDTASPSDSTANGGGITLKGATDKTITWNSTTGRWSSNQRFDATSLENTPIGAVTESTGKFTTINSTSTTESSTTTTGAVITAGGLGVAKQATINNVKITATTATTSSSTGSLIVAGGAGVAGGLFADTLITINKQAAIDVTTPGTSQYGLHFQGQTTADYAAGITWNGGTGTTGAQAGIYVQGSGSYGTKMYFATTSSYATGAITRLNIQHDGQVRVVSNLASTSKTSGSLVVTGGVGVSGDVYATKFVGAIEGTVTGNADSATQVKTQSAGDANANYFLTFVDTNNTSATNETVYTDGTLGYNPSTNTLTTTTFSGALSGNATTATSLSSTRANYKGVTDSNVVGQLMWKNYGNNHTIFDASAGTTPTGAACNNTNPDVSWSATYPTLMGYNGTNTYGVRVDRAKYAEDSNLLDGLDLHTGRNNEANKVVRTDGSGYLQTGYINSSSGDEGNNSNPTRVWGTNGSDSYMRTYLTSALSVNSAVNATYLGTTQQTSIITGKQQSMNMGGSSADGSFVCRASGTGDANLAGIVYWNDSYAIKMGIRADGYFGLGGWSRAAWSWYSDPSGNMVAAGNVTAYSDPRLKENFQRIESPLDIVNRLDGGTFTWREGFEHTAVKAGKKDYGVLADQVEAVMPEIVTESIEIEGERYKTVAYEKLVPVLLEAIKAQQAQIDELKTEVNKLKSGK